MEIIPAIDLKRGTCVRLLQGQDDATTEYSNDPVTVAREWVRQGAKRLHVVNLDGAFGRASGNLEIVKNIAAAIDAEIEFGGGLRSMDDVEMAINSGVDKVVLGTAAIEDLSLLKAIILRYGTRRIVVALDALDGKVATRGWQTVSKVDVVQAAEQVREIGVSEILYTDIKRDGMLVGPDFDTLKRLAATGLNIIASGGVSSNADVIKLLELRLPSISGVIIGKALYERRILLPDLFEELRRFDEN